MKETDFHTSYDAYHQLFGNPEDFTFIVSGNFDNSILPLLQKYLGNLPKKSPSLRCTTSQRGSTDMQPQSSIIKIPAPEYYKMKSLQYGIVYAQEAKNPHDWKEQLKVEILGEITDMKVWSLRQEKGYSLYMVGASGKFNEEMERYEITSTFDCVPEEFPLIRRDFKRIISEIKNGFFSKNDFQQTIDGVSAAYGADRLNVPRILNSRLFNYYRYRLPWLDPAEVLEFIESLTAKDIVETANKYYKEENLFEFEMRSKE